jgi:hypothetical protein
MKISINNIFVGLLIILANKMSAQLQIQYKNYTGIGYDAAANYQSAGVASDFGIRLLPTYDFHGGIDYGALLADGDLSYSTLVLESKNTNQILR